MTTPSFVALDLRPARESHLPNLSLCVAAGALRRAGGLVRQLSVLLPDGEMAGKGPPGGVAARLVSWLRSEAPSPVVIVERLWPAALLSSLRSAGGARIWWLRQEVDEPPPFVDLALGLDPRAIGGLAAFLAAGPGEHREVELPGLGYRDRGRVWRLRPGPDATEVRAALRRQWAPRFDWESLPGEPPPDRGEQVLLGAPGGCSYRDDARRNEVFAGVPVAGGATRWRGCTFCLDQKGLDQKGLDQKGHRKDGEGGAERLAETLSFLSRQLCWLAAEVPEAERFVLADNQPFPLLGPLFRGPALVDAALVDAALVDAALETAATGAGFRRRLLVKGRADALLRHADGLREAGRWAAAVGWTIELYCVGIEAFSDALLGLFNKGFSAQVAQDAAQLLRTLDGEPGLRTGASRAHGFLLWTPWTSLDDLAVTTRAVRRTRFDELRDDWASTRLRLDPRLPLHALALRDGLLGGGGAAGAAVDRAREQGYGAASPWGFRDPRVALVDRCFAAEQALPGDTDADRLERWTLGARGLTARSVAAALADPDERDRLAERLRCSWRRGAWQPGNGRVARWAGVPASACALDPGLDMLRAGQRELAIREGLSAHDAEALAALYEAQGFVVAMVPSAGQKGARDLLVAREEATVSRAEGAHGHLLAGAETDRAIRSLGRLLGYPACCVDAFAGLPDHSDDLTSAAATLAKTRGPLDPLLNPFALRQLVSFHPCRYDCGEARAFALRALAHVTHRLGEQVATGYRRAAGAAQVLWSVHGRYTLLGHRCGDETLRYAAAAGPDDERLVALRGADSLRLTAGGPRPWTEGRPLAAFAPPPRLLLIWGAPASRSWAAPAGPAFVAPPRTGARAGLLTGNSAAERVREAVEAAGAEVLRIERRRGGREVLLLRVGGQDLRLDLGPPGTGARAFADGADGTLGYRVGRPDGPAVSLREAPASVRRVVARAVRALTGKGR